MKDKYKVTKAFKDIVPKIRNPHFEPYGNDSGKRSRLLLYIILGLYNIIGVGLLSVICTVGMGIPLILNTDSKSHVFYIIKAGIGG